MPGRSPVGAYVEWCRTKGLAPRLVTTRAAMLTAAEHVMGVPLLKANPDDVTRWLTRLRERNLSDATVYVYAGHLSAFYEWAADAGYGRGRNPVRAAARPKRPRYLPRPIGQGPLDLAFTTADGRVRVILALAAMAGLRAVEIARLRREDILDQLPEPMLLVHGKGDKPRAVPLAATLLAELRAYGMPRRRGPLIRRHDGMTGHVSPSLISTVANRHLHDLGIPDTLHSLRHYAATTLYRAQKDLRLVQGVLGHASPSTTAIYTAWAQEDAPAALRALGETVIGGHGSAVPSCT